MFLSKELPEFSIPYGVSAEECDENIFAHTDEDKEDDGDEHDKEDEEEDGEEEDEDKA